MTSFERNALRIAVFSSGALLMALEVAAFRIIGKTFGAALRETTAVIAVFLAAMSAGYWAGGRVADRRPDASTLMGALIGAAVILLSVPLLDAWLSPLIARSGLAMAAHAFAASALLFALPTFMLAATSPIAIRLFTTSARESGSVAGSISAISTAGSIFGTVVTAFFLIDWLQSVLRTVIFVAEGALATALLVWISSLQSFPDRRLAKRTILAGIAAAAVLLVGGAAFVRGAAIDRGLIEPLPGTRILFAGDSPYHHIVVKERRRHRELYFNVGRQSAMHVDDPYGPGLPYTDTLHLGPLMRPTIRRVLMIGLGGGTAAKQYERIYPDATIDVVEVDPLVPTIAGRFFHVRPSERLRIHIGDGRTFLKRSAKQWDLIILDAYTTGRYGDTMPPHLVTREFFEEARRHLSDGGVFHLHCAFASTPLLPALEKTMTSVFPHIVRAGGELIGSSAPLIVPKETLLSRAQRGSLARLPHLPGAIESLTAERLPHRDVPLLTDDYAPVDTLLGRHD